MMHSYTSRFTFLWLFVGAIVLSCTVNAFVRCPTLHEGRARTCINSSPVKKETTDTFRKADFISAVSEKTGMNKKESEEALKAVLDVITEEVIKGKRVSLPSFGTFTLKERSARKGRNPQTGEPLDIAASKSPAFSVAKAWKDAANGRS